MNIAMPPLLSVLVLAAVLTSLAQAVQMPPQSPPSLEKRDFSAEFERMKVFARNYPNWKPVDLSKVIGSRLSQSLSVEKMLAGSKFIKNNVAVGASHVAVDPIKIMEVKPVKVLQNQLQKTHEQITMLKITNQVAPATIISSNSISAGSDKVEKQQLEPFRRMFPVNSFSHSKKPFTLDWWLPNIKKYTPPTTTQPTTFKTQKPVFGNKLFNISSLLTPLLNQTAGIFFLDKNLTTGNFGFPFFLRARNMTLNLTLNRTSSSIRLFFPFPFLKQSKLEKVLKSSSKSVETEVEEAEKPKKVSKRQFGGGFGGGGFNGGGGFGGGFNNGGFGGGGFGGGGFGGGGGFRHHGGSNFNNNNGGGGGFGGSNFNNNNGGGGFGGSSFNNNNAIGGGFGGSNFNNNNAGGGFGGDNFNNNNGK